MQEEILQFDSIFSKYKNINDKHQSLYIFVINNLCVESVIEKIKKMIVIVDAGSNPSKKTYLKNKLNNFIETLLGIKPETVLNKICFVSDFVEIYDVVPYWQETLNEFKCDSFIVKYDNFFQLEWLRDLLIDRTYINAICLNNNNLKHFHLNHTKKKFFKEKEEKKMDLQIYIQENTNKNEITMVYGTSSFLKGLQTLNSSNSSNVLNAQNKLKIFNMYKKDDELLEEYDRIVNNEKSEQLQWWLDRMLDPKEGKKLLFGKDIGIGISESAVRIIFCSPERKKKLLENYPDNNLTDKIIVVNSYGNDVGFRLVTEFRGAVGIKFY